jgi:hypothetical protein
VHQHELKRLHEYNIKNVSSDQHFEQCMVLYITCFMKLPISRQNCLF